MLRGEDILGILLENQRGGSKMKVLESEQAIRNAQNKFKQVTKQETGYLILADREI